MILHQKGGVGVKDLPALGDEEPPASSYRFPSFKEASDAYHREFIQRKLDEAGGNVSRAAELMGIDRSHLYRRMRAVGLSATGGACGSIPRLIRNGCVDPLDCHVLQFCARVLKC